MKDPASVQAPWREHFYNLLNREAEVDQTVVNEFRQFPVKHELADLPTPHEVNLAIMSLKNGKATGPDGIPAEVLPTRFGSTSSQFHTEHLDQGTSSS